MNTKIQDERVIDYFDSPTGKAYVGVAKKPLQPIKNGYGFVGVLLQTDDRRLVQCHICGTWLKKISGQHLNTHNTKREEYIKSYSLLFSNSLVADQTSYRLEQSAYKKIEKHGYRELNSQKGNALHKREKYSKKVEHQNKYSICNAQLEYRLLEYIKKYKQLPTRVGKNEGAAILKALRKRFGSANNGLKFYGLPTFYRKGTTVELRSATGRQMFYNYNRHYNRDMIFKWIKDNTPKLTQLYEHRQA